MSEKSLSDVVNDQAVDDFQKVKEGTQSRFEQLSENLQSALQGKAEHIENWLLDFAQVMAQAACMDDEQSIEFDDGMLHDIETQLITYSKYGYDNYTASLFPKYDPSEKLMFCVHQAIEGMQGTTRHFSQLPMYISECRKATQERSLNLH